MSTTLVGSAFALARWFQPERFANRPEDDYVRDEILNDLVEFDYVSSERWERTAFWMNESSVRDLGEALRAKPRADFDAIFVGAEGTR
jgi:hypothetical protein